MDDRKPEALHFDFGIDCFEEEEVNLLVLDLLDSSYLDFGCSKEAEYAFHSYWAVPF